MTPEVSLWRRDALSGSYIFFRKSKHSVYLIKLIVFDLFTQSRNPDLVFYLVDAHLQELFDKYGSEPELRKAVYAVHNELF